jgi:hypothetical protein
MASLASRRTIISSDIVTSLIVANDPKRNNGVSVHVESISSRDNVVPVAVTITLKGNSIVVGEVTRVISNVDALAPTFIRVTLTSDGTPAPVTGEPSDDTVHDKSLGIEGWREVNATR